MFVSSSENANLNVLRTFAVACVVISHLSLLPKNSHLWAVGQWGVLLFFVHTSLVLMLSLARQERQFPRTNIFWPFYLRRIFRIYPLSIFVVSLLFVLRWPNADLHDGIFRAAHLNVWGFLSNLLLIQNVTKTQSITAPLWSLPCEMDMYLIFPLLFLLTKLSRTLWPVIALWAGAAVIGEISLHRFNGDSYSFSVLAPCFLAGIASYVVGKWARPRLPFGMLLALMIGITAWYLYGPKTSVIWIRASTSWVLCLAFGLALPFFREVKDGVLRKICDPIARYSYGIYLAHFACLWLAFGIMHNLPSFARGIIFFASVFLFSIVSYHALEAPFIALGRRIVDGIYDGESPVSDHVTMNISTRA